MACYNAAAKKRRTHIVIVNSGTDTWVQLHSPPEAMKKVSALSCLELCEGYLRAHNS